MNTCGATVANTENRNAAPVPNGNERVHVGGPVLQRLPRPHIEAAARPHHHDRRQEQQGRTRAPRPGGRKARGRRCAARARATPSSSASPDPPSSSPWCALAAMSGMEAIIATTPAASADDRLPAKISRVLDSSRVLRFLFFHRAALVDGKLGAVAGRSNAVDQRAGVNNVRIEAHRRRIGHQADRGLVDTRRAFENALNASLTGGTRHPRNGNVQLRCLTSLRKRGGSAIHDGRHYAASLAS